MVQEDLGLILRFGNQTDIISERNCHKSASLSVERYRPVWRINGVRPFKGEKLVIALDASQINAKVVLGGNFV